MDLLSFASLTIFFTVFFIVIFYSYKKNELKYRLKRGDLQGAYFAAKDIDEEMEKGIIQAINDRKDFLLQKKYLNVKEEKELIRAIILTNSLEAIDRTIIFDMFNKLNIKEKKELLILSIKSGNKINNTFLNFLTRDCQDKKIFALAAKATNSPAYKKKFKCQR